MRREGGVVYTSRGFLAELVAWRHPPSAYLSLAHHRPWSATEKSMSSDNAPFSTAVACGVLRECTVWRVRTYPLLLCNLATRLPCSHCGVVTSIEFLYDLSTPEQLPCIFEKILQRSPYNNCRCIDNWSFRSIQAYTWKQFFRLPTLFYDAT